MRAFPNSSARAMVASRSPTPTTGGSTPSGRATPDHQSGYQLIDNCRSIEVPGTAATRSREDRSCVAHRSACASRLTGGAPGSYPGTDWVRDPGRAPRCRSSTGLSASPSSWRMRVRIPSAAPRRRGRMDEAPVYETGRMQVRLLPSTPTRRSSAEQSAALRRRRPHVRIVPARPGPRSSGRRARPWYGRGRGCDSHRGPHGREPAR